MGGSDYCIRPDCAGLRRIAWCPVSRLWKRSAEVRGGGGVTSLGEWEHNNKQLCGLCTAAIAGLDLTVFIHLPQHMAL